MTIGEQAEYLGSPYAEELPDSERLLRLILLAQKVPKALQEAEARGIEKEAQHTEVYIKEAREQERVKMVKQMLVILNKIESGGHTVKEFIHRVEGRLKALTTKTYDKLPL